MRRFLERFTPLLPDTGTASLWARIKTACEKKGRPITFARRLDCGNADDYGAVDGLTILTAPAVPLSRTSPTSFSRPAERGDGICAFKTARPCDISQEAASVACSAAPAFTRNFAEDILRRCRLPKPHLVLLLATALFGQTDANLTEQVRRAEIAFAKTMADRDYAAFRSFLAEEAVFVGPNRVLRGAQEVAAAWKRFYEDPQAPFSWEPDQVQVLSSGTLALSSGPVRDPSGKRTGTFNSIWRREADGKWRIVIDHGCPPCDCGGR